MTSPPTGQERVSHKLKIVLKAIARAKKLQKATSSPQKQKSLDACTTKIARGKKALVFLSMRARDPVTRFYASNALKEIAQKQKGSRY